MRKILQVGLPAGFQGILFSLSNVVIQSSVNTFGEVHHGRKLRRRQYRAVRVCLHERHVSGHHLLRQSELRRRQLPPHPQDRHPGPDLRVGGGADLGNLATLFGRGLLAIYTTSPAVIDAGLIRMRIICTTYAICGMMDVMVGGLRGIGYSVMPMLVSLVGACGLRLVWIATIFQLPRFPHHPDALLVLSRQLDHHPRRPCAVLPVGLKRVKRHLLAQSEAVDPAAEMSEEPAAR